MLNIQTCSLYFQEQNERLQKREWRGNSSLIVVKPQFCTVESNNSQIKIRCFIEFRLISASIQVNRMMIWPTFDVLSV